MILYEGPSLLDGTPIVAIATEDENPKTGRMLFTWILRQDRPPDVAAYDGSDDAICGDCKFRAPTIEPVGSKLNQASMRNLRTCYVRLSPAEGADEAMPPSEVWRKWKEDDWPCYTGEDPNWGRNYDVFPARLLHYKGPLPVRLGGYGDPAAVPTRVWAELVRYAKNWTGYTHMWKPKPCKACVGTGEIRIFRSNNCSACNGTGYEWQPDPDLKKYCMASVDTPEERAEAQALGWRTFCVTPEPNAMCDLSNPGVSYGDVLCPATDPDPKRGKVCPDCKGERWIWHVERGLEHCLSCKGTGRVSTTCAVCGLCRGTTARSPSIWEVVHGKHKDNHKW